MKKIQVCMLALLIMMAVGASAQTENVTFKFYYYDDLNRELIAESETQNCTLIEGQNDEWMGLGELGKTTYYAVKGNVRRKTLNCFGDVHIVLCDNATLTCTGGILVNKVHEGKLSIYSQSTGDSKGKLIVTNSYEWAAGIGSSTEEICGEINIYGGHIEATGGRYGSGIGNGFWGKGTSKEAPDDINIYGGYVKAQGGESGSGIGNGCNYINRPPLPGRVNIFGGTIDATGGELAAGIGGGGAYETIFPNSYFSGSDGFEVNVYGGNITAQGGRRAAGIGSGSCTTGSNNIRHGGTLTIYSGTIKATGGDYGAGIGGGCNGQGTDIIMEGGTINAFGGKNSAGIGGGEDGLFGALTVYAGTITATIGENCTGTDEEGGSAIGPGKGESKNGIGIYIENGLLVRAGESQDNIERVFTISERSNACVWRNYAKIESCPHTVQNGDDASTAITYTNIDESRHDKHCNYCGKTIREAHTGTECPCGYKKTQYKFTVYEAGQTKDTYSEGATTTVSAGNKFYLPTCTHVPEGYIFAGWQMNPDVNENDYVKWVYPSELIQPKDVVEAIKGMDDAKFYARYYYIYKEKWDWSWEYVDGHTNTSAKLTLSHPDIDDIVKTGTQYQDGSAVNITSEYDGSYTHYTGTVTYDDPYGSSNTFTSKKTVCSNMLIYDNQDNKEIIEKNNGGVATNASLFYRTLYKDGKWNTICLPFDLSAEQLASENCPLHGAVIKELKSSTLNNGTLTLNFSDEVTAIEAGKPYIIKWSEGTNIESPSFRCVTINNVNRPTTTDNVIFMGDYSPVNITSDIVDQKEILFLGADNKLYYPNTALTILSCRAFFKLRGITVSDLAQGAKSIVLNFGETTGISNTTASQGETNNYWYSLDGRRLNGKPTRKGVYIHQGKKIVVK